MSILAKSTPSQVCFLLIELVLVLLFLLFLAAAVFTKPNIGSAAGMFICALLTVILVKRSAFVSLIKTAYKTQAGKVIITAIAVLAVIGVITAIVISVLMIRATNNLPDEPTTVIVLGCRVKENGPSLMLQKRMDAAYDYMTENENVICIASGGQGSDEPMSEAQAIKNSLVEKGISPDRIIMEDKSENTFQNIRNSLEIFDSMGMSRKAVIITSEFHQLRAKMIASKQGLECYSKSSPTYPPLLPSYWVREWFGVLHELIIGRK